MSDQVNEQEVVKKITLLMEKSNTHSSRASAFKESCNAMQEAALGLAQRAHEELDKCEALQKEARSLLNSIGG